MDELPPFRIDPDSGTVVFGDGEIGAVPPPGGSWGSSYRQGGGASGNVGSSSPSAIRRLLDEISWEGNARKYRGGGGHLENVVTTEVFGMLDFLPREHFLAPVLRDAHGADRARWVAASRSEDALVDVLPGDVSPTWLSGEPTGWRIQPDVLIASPDSLVYVEAKALHGGTFSTSQLARSLHTTLHEARDRTGTLLLVLDTPPPIRVRPRGRLSLRRALEAGLSEFPDVDAGSLRARLDSTVSWTTWTDIAASVQRSLASFACTDLAVHGTVSRLADTLIRAADPPH